MKKCMMYAAMILALMSCLAYAEGIHGVGLQFDVKILQFAFNSQYNTVEVYLAVPRKSLTYTLQDSVRIARYEIGVKIMQGDSSFTKKRQFQDTLAADAEHQNGTSFQGLFSFAVGPGKYIVNARITDLNTGKGGWYQEPCDVRLFLNDSLALSDIELATKIYPDKSKHLFVKNGYHVTPNLGGVYGVHLPILYYYTEIYNLSPLIEDFDSTYTVQVSLLNDKDEVQIEMPAKIRLRAGSSVVDVGELLVSTYHSGTYRLKIVVTDNGNQAQAFRIRDLFVYRPDDFENKEPAAQDQNIGEFAGMDEETLDMYWKSCRYIASKDEKKVYSNLSVDGKRQFLARFWNMKDTDPLTPENEFRKDYFERVGFANKNYSTIKQKGWDTDRGRVLLTYGQPDDVDRYPSGQDHNPYEIWYFHQLEGGVEFVFVDIYGTSDYKLVHSTHREELYDSNWMRWLE